MQGKQQYLDKVVTNFRLSKRILVACNLKKLLKNRPSRQVSQTMALLPQLLANGTRFWQRNRRILASVRALS